jgi:hypothetical protein
MFPGAFTAAFRPANLICEPGLGNSWSCLGQAERGGRRRAMCRNIRTLFNFEPPATDDEVRASSLQFVRKLSGFNAPSRANEAAFNRAVEDVFQVARRLVDSLVTQAPTRDRAVEAAKARARGNSRSQQQASASAR